MTDSKHHSTEKIIGASYDAMDERTKKVARHISERKHISKNTAIEQNDTKTAGQRAADAVAKFGGSWAFIILFGVVLVCWVVLNSFILINYNKAFDPYPYILLNLFLSMLASIQAPIILMSQNRSAAKDRAAAQHDYEVNLKAELEVMALHQKVDVLRETQWAELITLQQQQIAQLTQLLKQSTARTNQ